MTDERLRDLQLDRFWDSLVLENQEPAGDSLNPEEVETVRMFQRHADAPLPAAARATSWQAVKDRIDAYQQMEQSTMDMNDALQWQTIPPSVGQNGRFGPAAPRLEKRRPIRWLSMQFAMAVLLIVALLGVYFVLNNDNRPATQPATPSTTPFSGWTHAHGNAARTGEANAGPIGQPVEIWRFQARGPCDWSPSAVSNAVFAICGRNDGILHAINAATGTTRWQFTTSYPLGLGPVVAGNLVYMIDALGKVHAVDIATGREHWQYSGAGVTTSPVVADGVLAAGTLDGLLVGIDPASGEELWRFDATLRGATTSPAIANGVVYAGTELGGFVAVDASDGQLRWRADTGTEPIFAAAVADGIVLAGTITSGFYANQIQYGSLYAFDAETGEELWRSNESIHFPVVSNGTAYASSDADSILALDIATGDEQWRVQGNPGDEALAVAAGIVYVSSFNSNYVYALDASNGAELWRFPVDGNTSIAVTDGVMYVSTSLGVVYAIGEADDARSSPVHHPLP